MLLSANEYISLIGCSLQFVDVNLFAALLIDSSIQILHWFLGELCALYSISPVAYVCEVEAIRDGRYERPRNAIFLQINLFVRFVLVIRC